MSSGGGVSSSLEDAPVFPRVVDADFADLFREAAAAALERMELNFDHPS